MIAAAPGSSAPSISGWILTSRAGFTIPRRLRFVSGYSRCSSFITVSTLPRACASVAVGASRPVTKSHRDPRRVNRVAPVGDGTTSFMPTGSTSATIDAGTHSSAINPGVIPVNEPGITPTIV